MSEEVSWLVELVIKPGQLDNFRALTGEMVESSRREAGVLSYQRLVSADGKFVYAYERRATVAGYETHPVAVGHARHPTRLEELGNL